MTISRVNNVKYVNPVYMWYPICMQICFESFVLRAYILYIFAYHDIHVCVLYHMLMQVLHNDVLYLMYVQWLYHCMDVYVCIEQVYS